MGGKLLQAVCRRHGKDEYLEKVNAVTNKISDSGVDIGLWLTSTYLSKDTFGDADILYDVGKNINMVDLVNDLFAPKMVVKNGPCISFDYDELQIDLILCDESWIHFAYFYHGNADVGNFMGKLARHIGLSLGHDGLFMPVRDYSLPHDENNHDLIGKILLTTDPIKAMAILDLNAKAFANKFETKEDIYRFVQASKYFNPSSYAYENISHIGRVRDKKRESYGEFLEFNKTYTGPVAEKRPKHEYMDMIFKYFPDAQSKYEHLMGVYAMKKIAKAKFNGTLVSTHSGLTGESLGKCMSFLKTKPFYGTARIVQASEQMIGRELSKDLEEFYTNCYRK